MVIVDIFKSSFALHPLISSPSLNRSRPCDPQLRIRLCSKCASREETPDTPEDIPALDVSFPDIVYTSNTSLSQVWLSTI